MYTLKDKRVLIVEDDWLQANELASHLSQLGAEIVGPAANIASGLKLAPAAEIAVLDVDLKGEAVFPVADELKDRGVPIVFYSAYSKSRLPPRFRGTSHLAKPSRLPVLEEAIYSAIINSEPKTESVADMLPRLRLTARLLMPEPVSADRLVELVLRRAIETGQPADEETSRWLFRLMQDVARERGGNLLC